MAPSVRQVQGGTSAFVLLSALRSGTIGSQKSLRFEPWFTPAPFWSAQWIVTSACQIFTLFVGVSARVPFIVIGLGVPRRLILLLLAAVLRRETRPWRLCVSRRFRALTFLNGFMTMEFYMVITAVLVWAFPRCLAVFASGHWRRFCVDVRSYRHCAWRPTSSIPHVPSPSVAAEIPKSS